MATCKACGDALTNPVFRTREPKCYVFQGDAGDFRNGIKLHTRSGVILADDETSLIVPLAKDDWLPPQHERDLN